MVCNNCLISVIVPVYNTEKYLRKCLDSIIYQTHTQLDIILVDDGSTDDSGIICDDYAAKDNRIRVVHKVNEGQAKARNIALKMIKGDSVAFVDSDDWLELDALEYSINFMHTKIVDAVLYDYYMTGSRKPAIIKNTETLEIYKGKECLQWFMEASIRSSRYFGMCAGLYKKDILDGLFFRECRAYEDMDYRYRVISRCNSIAVSNAKKYYYYIDCNSTTTSGLRMQDFQLREANDLLCKLASKEDCGNIRQIGEAQKAKTAFSILSKIVFYGVADKTIDIDKTISELQKEHRRNLKILLSSPLDIKRKILACLLAVSVKGTTGIINLSRNLRIRSLSAVGLMTDN